MDGRTDENFIATMKSRLKRDIVDFHSRISLSLYCPRVSNSIEAFPIFSPNVDDEVEIFFSSSFLHRDFSTIPRDGKVVVTLSGQFHR